MRDRGLRKFGETGHGEAAVPVDVGPERCQPDQPGRAGEKGAYPSEVAARNLASCDSIGRERGKGGRREKHERGDRGTNEVDGGSAAAAGGDGSSTKSAEGSALRGCYRCGKQGRIRAECTEKLCNRCNGRGHTADVWPTSTEEAVLAVTGVVGAMVDVGEDGAVQASDFHAEVTDEFGNDISEMGDEELARQVGGEAWLSDSEPSIHMTPSADHMINYRECDLKTRFADGTTRSLDGHVDLSFVFPSGNGLVDVLLTNVAHVPDLSYHLFSLPTLIKNGHAFEGRYTDIIVRLKPERSIVFPLSGTLFSLYGYRVDSSSRENACAVLATRKPPNKSAINVNDFRCAAGNFHEVLLRKTAEQQGVVLEEKLQECKGGSMARGLRKGIKQSMHTRR